MISNFVWSTIIITQRKGEGRLHVQKLGTVQHIKKVEVVMDGAEIATMEFYKIN